MTDLKVKKKVLTAAEAAGLTEHEAALSAHIVKSLVPDPDILDKYEHRKIGGYTDFEVLDVARALQHNVLLGGPTGSGKSLLFRAYGAHHGVPVATVSCSGASDPATWFGSYRPFPNPDGTPGFVWVDGIVTAVLRSGGVVFFDEVNFLRNDVAAAVHQVLRERELILLDKGNEVVKASPDTLIVAALNDGDEYGGTNELNAAFANRFAISLSWDYDPDVEARLVVKSEVLELAKVLRNSIEEGAILTPVPTNALIEFEEIAANFDSSFACDVFLNRFRPGERLVVEEQITLLGLRSLSYDASVLEEVA